MKILNKYIIYILYFCVVFITPTFFLASGILPLDITILHFLMYLCFYAAIFLYRKLYSAKNAATIIGCIAPIIIATIVGLYINPKGLFPLIFPLSTALFLLAFCQMITKRVYLLNGFNIILIVLFAQFIYPKIAVQKKLTKENISLVDYNFTPLLKPDSTELLISKDEKSILEFMFLDCTPCRQKLDYLQELGKESIPIYVIVNGQIDSYNEYLKYYECNRNKLSNILFLYDSHGVFTRQFAVTAYPTEVILKNRTIIARDLGFPKQAKAEYVKIRKSILE